MYDGMMLNPVWVLNIELLGTAFLIYDVIINFKNIDQKKQIKYAVLCVILTAFTTITGTFGYVTWMFWCYALVYLILFIYTFRYRFNNVENIDENHDKE